MTIYFSRSCAINKNGEASATGGLWYGENDEWNIALRIDSKNPSCQIGELAGVCWAIKREPLHTKLHLIWSSKLVIQGLTTNLPKWEAKGFIRTTHKDISKATAAALWMRTAPTTFQQAKSSGNLRGSKEAYALAKEGTYKETYDEPDLGIEPKFDLTGVQLSELSQALAYEGICKQRTLQYKRGLDMVLDITLMSLLIRYTHIPFYFRFPFAFPTLSIHHYAPPLQHNRTTIALTPSDRFCLFDGHMTYDSHVFTSILSVSNMPPPAVWPIMSSRTAWSGTFYSFAICSHSCLPFIFNLPVFTFQKRTSSPKP